LVTLIASRADAAFGGVFKGPCLITQCSGVDGCVPGRYTSATMTFNDTEFSDGGCGDFQFAATYQDEFSSGSLGTNFGRCCYSSSSGGWYHTPYDYYGSCGVNPSGAGGFGAGVYLNATFDQNSQAVSGTFTWAQSESPTDTAGSFNCEFHGLKSSSPVPTIDGYTCKLSKYADPMCVPDPEGVPFATCSGICHK
jgi:hypothetical protein